MALIETPVLVTQYLSMLMGGVGQIVFLLLPVDLKNWEEDLLNVFTYIAMQMFAACFIFIGVPLVFDLVHFNSYTSFCIIVTVFFLAWFRVLKIIPLEFTFHITRPPYVAPKVLFNEFYDARRMSALSDISLNDPDGVERYARIRERLAKAKSSRMDKFVEQGTLNYVGRDREE